jgi:hypothetical protein
MPGGTPALSVPVSIFNSLRSVNTRPTACDMAAAVDETSAGSQCPEVVMVKGRFSIFAKNSNFWPKTSLDFRQTQSDQQLKTMANDDYTLCVLGWYSKQY